MRDQINFIFHSEARRIFDTFTRLLDIRMVFFSAQGREVMAGAGRDLCNYCRMLRCELGLVQNCRKNDLEKQLESKEKSELIVYTCYAGMIEAVLPVNIVEKNIGYIMIGQFRNQDKCPPDILKLWRDKTGNNLLEQAFLEAPYYHQDKINDIIELFSLLTSQIMSQHLITTQSSDAISKLISFMDENPQHRITLGHAVNMLNMSPSSFTQHFRKITGRSFKQYVIEEKMKLADKWLTESPDMKIYQIAHNLGYEDQYFFSRLYKKHRGQSPAKARG